MFDDFALRPEDEIFNDAIKKIFPPRGWEGGQGGGASKLPFGVSSYSSLSTHEVATDSIQIR